MYVASLPLRRVATSIQTSLVNGGSTHFLLTSTKRLFSGKGKYYTVKDYVPRRTKRLNWMQSEEKDEIDLYPKPPPKISRTSRVWKLTDFVTGQPTEQDVSVQTSMPEHVKTCLRALRPYWRVAHLGTAITKLYRINLSGPKIQLSFHCQDAVVNPKSSSPSPSRDPPRAASKSQKQIWEERDHMLCRDHDPRVVTPPVAFTLTVTNQQKKSLVLIGIADDGCTDSSTYASSPLRRPTMRIYHVSVTPTNVDIVHATGAVNETYYSGRAFDSLTPNLQRALNRYVEEEIRVDRDVVDFITTYFVYREERQYEDFLLSFHALVQ